ncbi:MAG: hypothetical protein J5792_07840 [Bacteroidales bacterium]|nr:hypothetical protein [Bacteroidales bacterium]
MRFKRAYNLSATTFQSKNLPEGVKVVRMQSHLGRFCRRRFFPRRAGCE